jgi:hypothetical protein
MSALFQRDDFQELVDLAADKLSINPAIVEKDYYVTEALRAIVSAYGEAIMFKGGTSLSKGWGLIDRFSEDIDLYVDPGQKGEKARESLLKSVIDTAGSFAAFEGGPNKENSIKGVARAARLSYASQREAALVVHSVLVELGIQSGTFPFEIRQITSLLADQLIELGQELDQEDCRPFAMKLLHFRRTFVEKMFALHDKIERGLIRDGKSIGTYARHYYDLAQLAGRPEVLQMLSSDEYIEIVRDYHAVTTKYFSHQVFPDKLELGRSSALFPDDVLRESLEGDYEEQCRVLCYRQFPSFSDVLDMFEDIRSFLVAVS